MKKYRVKIYTGLPCCAGNTITEQVKEKKFLTAAGMIRYVQRIAGQQQRGAHTRYMFFVGETLLFAI